MMYRRVVAGLLSVLLTFPLAAVRPALAATETYTVNTGSDVTSPGACAAQTPGKCSVREAVLEANAAPAGSTVTIQVPAGTYLLSAGRLSLASAAMVTITGAGADQTTISANNTGMIMTVAGGTTATVSNLTLTGGNMTPDPFYYYGAISNSGALTLDSVAVTGNSGPAVGNLGSLKLTNSTINNNTLWNSGAYAVLWNLKNATLTVQGSTISANVGRGVEVDGPATVQLTQTTIESNDAGNEFGGGGILINAGAVQVTLTNTTIANNHADDGGGIMIEPGTSGPLPLINSTVSGNAMNTGEGAGIENWGSGPLTISGSTIANNHCAGCQGGGVFSDGPLTITNSVISGNDAGGYSGGGVYGPNDVPLWITNSTISGNHAAAGAGLYIESGQSVLSGLTISGNQASSQGGGIYSLGSPSITNSTISGNTAPVGGGVYQYALPDQSGASFAFSTIAANSSGLSGPLHLLGSIVADSTSGANCAGSIDDQGYNLDSGASCGFTRPTSLSNTAPLLGPLANNGGPTQTMALLPGSPAIDAGGSDANGCPPTDQRGVSRPQGAACDIGAYEAGAASVPRKPPAPAPQEPPRPTAPRAPAPQGTPVAPHGRAPAPQS